MTCSLSRKSLLKAIVAFSVLIGVRASEAGIIDSFDAPTSPTPTSTVFGGSNQNYSIGGAEFGTGARTGNLAATGVGTESAFGQFGGGTGTPGGTFMMATTAGAGATMTLNYAANSPGFNFATAGSVQGFLLALDQGSSTVSLALKDAFGATSNTQSVVLTSANISTSTAAFNFLISGFSGVNIGSITGLAFTFQNTVGTDTSFNNIQTSGGFSPALGVPEPASMLVWGSMAAAGLFLRRRNRS
jgi:hypothetical protein